jgi:tetratricopeptide (TPR) repeat protein
MIDKHLESEYYNNLHAAINHPQTFLSGFKLTRKKQNLMPANYWNLLYAKTLMVTGEVVPAFNLLKDLWKLNKPSDDHLFLGLLFLSLHNLEVNISGRTSEAEQYLKKAEQQIKTNRSKAQACELKLFKTQYLLLENNLSGAEAMLSSALEDAMDAEVLDLRLEVNLSFCRYYVCSNLFDKMSRELQLLSDLIPLESHPYQYLNLMNYIGVMHEQLKEHSQALDCINKALAVAQDNSFKLMQIPLLINLGVAHTQSERYEDGLKTYYQALELIEECQLHKSENAQRVQNNIGRLLGRMDRLEEAISRLRALYVSATKDKNLTTQHIQGINLAEYLIEVGEFEESEALLHSATDYFHSVKHYLYLTIGWRCLSKLFRAKHDNDKALEAMDQVDQFNRLLFAENFNKQRKTFDQQLEKIRTEFAIVKSK